MTKLAEQKALKAYPMDEYEFDKAKKSNIERSRHAYIKGYDQAMQDIFDYIEAHIPCGELSSGDVLGFINECKKLHAK